VKKERSSVCEGLGLEARRQRLGRARALGEPQLSVNCMGKGAITDNNLGQVMTHCTKTVKGF
jgi:hypothetical protein